MGLWSAIKSFFDPFMPLPPPLPPDGWLAPEIGKPVGEAVNQFGFALHHQLQGAHQGNFAFSPVSVWTALALTQVGARNKTDAALRRVLALGNGDAVLRHVPVAIAHWNDPSRATSTLRNVSRLFVNSAYQILPEYSSLAASRFRADAESLDFQKDLAAACNRINAWVTEQTEGRIGNLVSPSMLPTPTPLVLANAIYFLGAWEQPFRSAFTQPAPFHVSEGETQQVPMMHKTTYMRAACVDGVEIIALSYEGRELAMTLAMPPEGVTLDSFEKTLDPSFFTRELNYEEIELRMPRFTIEDATAMLRDPLCALGLDIAFNLQADFTGIAPNEGDDKLVIGDVVHKTYVRVDEEGTEAAAATALVVPLAMAAPNPPPPRKVTFDRPFLFAIREQSSGAIFFLGRVVRP